MGFGRLPTAVGREGGWMGFEKLLIVVGGGGGAGTEMLGTVMLGEGANDGRINVGSDTGRETCKLELRTSDDDLEMALGPEGVPTSPPGLAVTVT